MDDDKKNKGRGSRGPAGTGGKPDGKRFGARPSGGRFAGKGEGAKRSSPRDRGSEGEAGKKPFRKGPRPERAEGDETRSPPRKREFSGDRPFAGEKRPFREKREISGERPERRAASDRPFGKGPRREGGTEGGDRPVREKREFSGARPTRGAASERPFHKRPRAEGSGERRDRPFRDRKPFDAGSREADAGADAATERPFREEPRREWKRDGERKPFDKSRSFRPGRAEREAAKAEGGEKPRSFGMKRHADGERRDGGGKPRSYGSKSHASPKAGAERPRSRAPEAPQETGERIAKRLARAGIASRREAEDLVEAGRVRVNGQLLTSPAVNVAPEDRIELDGVEIPPIERTRLFLFHKPAGVVTTNRDPEGRRTVFDVLPEGLPRLMTVGRLDINTEGLLLLTNDGGLARVLELPATGWLRRYRVRVHGEVDERALAGLREGIAVGGVFYGAIEASLERVQGTNAWLTLGLREGKNREVKNVLGALGLEVTRLIRISFGPFQLGELPEGEVQELKGRTLRDQLGERLIEEAGANFEAPINTPFSGKAEQRRPSGPEGGERPRMAPRPVEVGEGGLIKGRKRRREDARDEALGKLSTRPDRDRFDKRRQGPGSSGTKPFGKPARGERETRGPEAPAQRKSNVWMAPGARPQGKDAKPRPKDGSAPRGRPSGPRSGEARGPRRPRKD